mmetsp:Transcript_9600/g.29049  ORF Transcript_9600/g.29049 Transcript_9600/m.29049 type:complete len:206 (+) Transcript_9600:537-1154(+)
MIRDENLSFPRKSALRMAILAIKSATCVNLYFEQQSPTAKMLGCEVCSLSLIATPSFLENLTPALASSRPLTFGVRPAATRRASKTCVLVPCFVVTFISISWKPPTSLPVFLRLTYESTSRWNTVPSSVILFCRMSAASLSSLPMMRPPRPKTDTSEPKRVMHWAISRPMAPLPMTAKRGGSLVRLKMLSLVTIVGAPGSCLCDA